MANFTLKLLVPNNDSDKNIVIGQDIEEHFLSTLITSFNSQLNEYNTNKEQLVNYQTDNTNGSIFPNHSISYTYNEKFSKHKNGQKELTFDLDDKYLTDSAWELNPYARVLHVGTLLELTDKYKNVYLFIITKVTPTFTNLNIKYSYTCQDLFTYQLSRQNSGYNLKNDETSSDFIGALSLDEWATMITKECYINYTYVPLNSGVIMTENGAIMQYKGPLNTNNIYKVLKKAYNSSTDPELFETIPFSVSGSSAAAALISLADAYGAQLKVVEGYNSEYENNDVYNYFFWFEPLKNDDVSGLMYSPKREVQNFGMSFSGDALTTVLNVNSTTWNDEEIGLFPSVPSFFINFFASNAWDYSTYEPGFFDRIVQGEYRTNLELQSEKTIHNHIATVKINIENWKTYYNKIQFVWDDEHYLILNVNNTLYTPLNTVFKIQIKKYDKDHVLKEYTYIAGDEIDNSLLEEYQSLYLIFDCYEPDSDDAAITINQNYYILTRNYTQEEVEFAQVAEKLPWLENKLIDFSYFLKQGIISCNEYESIQNELTNTVRIINGKLMCYASAHFRAIHEQVKTLAGIQAAVDALGAAFDAEIVQSYAQTGKPINNFGEYQNAYQSFFNTDIEEKEPLYELNNNISFLFNKYFQAEQRVLCNLYEFRRFFEERNAFASNINAIMEEVTYSINAAAGNNIVKDGLNNKFYLYSFDNELKFVLLSSTNLDSITNNYEPLVDLYKYSNGVYKKTIIPSKNTLDKQDGSILIPSIEQGSLLDDSALTIVPYSEDYYYYLPVSTYTNTFYKTPTQRIFTINGTNYVQLTLFELKQLHIKYQNSIGNGESYYIRDEQYYISYREYVWSTFESSTNRKGISGAFKNYMLPLANKWSGFVNDLKTKLFLDLDETTWNFYKASLPLDNLYIKDYNFSSIDNNIQILDENGNAYKYSAGQFSQYNKKTKEYENINVFDLYKTYYTIPYISINSSVQSLLFTMDDSTITSKNLFSILTSFIADIKSATEKYYTCTIDNTAKGWATAGAIGVLGLAGIPLAIYLNTQGRKHFASWTQSDRPDYSITYWNNNSWRQYENNIAGSKCSINDSNIDSGHIGDNVIPNYLKESNGDETITKLTNDLLNSDFYATLNSGWKHYYNYFSHIAATYSTEMHDNTGRLLVLSRNASIIQMNDVLNPKETYYWVEKIVKDENNDSKQVVNLSKIITIPEDSSQDLNTSFNATKYYPLVTNKEKVDFNSLFNKEELINNISLSNLVSRINAKNSLHNISVTVGGDTAADPDNPTDSRIALFTFSDGNSYYLIHDEPYQQRNITNGVVSPYIPTPVATPPDILWLDIDTTKIYNTKTHKILSATDLQIPVTYGIKRQAKKDMAFITATSADWPISDPCVKCTTNYINTEILPQSNTAIEIDFKLLEAGTNTTLITLFGSESGGQFVWDTKAKYVAQLRKSETSDQFALIIKYGTYNQTSDYYLTKNIRYKLKMSREGVFINNQKVLFFDFSDYTNWTATATKTIYLLANNATIVSTSNKTINIYSCKIYQNQELVRDYIPDELISGTGIGQLWDNVSETGFRGVGIMYYNANNVDETHWYDKNEERIYSIPQIQSENLYSNYSFLSGSSLKTIEFYDGVTATRRFSPTINRFTCYYDKDSTLITDETTVMKDFSGEQQLTCANEETVMVAPYGDTTLEISRSVDQQYNIGKMSNGEFWYAFHGRLDIPDLMQQSAVIETKLTEHWSVAYNASLYSRWFIPRAWQLNTEGNTNYFSDLIWIVNSEDGSTNVQLSTAIVPEIKILSSNNGQKDITLLNNYNLIYINSSDVSSVDTEYVYIEDSDLNNNPAFLETYKQIFGNEPINRNFVAQPYGKRTYYYVTYGGLTRMQAANKLTGGAAPSELFDGLYGMQLHKLLKTYCHLRDSLYTKYFNKKIAFWRQLYRRYPGVFLENIYSNEDARTSDQLYQMANLAMRDYTSPETQYNITTIDILSLEGYRGQDLNIGDSILLNASDYYQDVDETFRALNQYLFITDISYSLRQDTDIALTVNAIKYQDKLIQSLVKLIR